MSTRLQATDSGRLRYRLSAAQVEAMIENGIIPEGVDLELVGGILYKMVKKEAHNYTVGRIAEALRNLLPEGFLVREEKSLRHGRRSLPEPDVIIAPGRSGEFRPQPPSTSEVALIVEVCHHTRKTDYHDKCRLYAAGGVPEYWIVDLHERCIAVFRIPGGSGATASFAEVSRYLENESVTLTLDGREIGMVAVSEILPPDLHSAE